MFTPIVAIFLGVPLTTALGYALPGPYSLALCQASLAVGLLWFYSRKQELGRALGGLLIWAAWLIPVSVAFDYFLPELSSEKIPQGTSYWLEMSRWIREGVGTEAEPRVFIGRQLRDLVLICGASFLTGGAAGLFGGVLLMGKMNFYVATLLSEAADPWTAALYAWQPYALVRVAGYVLVGGVAAQPLLGQLSGFKPNKKALLYLILGLMLVFLDLILKTALQPHWREALKRASGL